MSNRTRKHIWPVALMPLVVAGVVAVVVALSGASPQPAQAHECEDLTGSERARCESLHMRDGVDHDADGNGGGTNGDGANGNGTMLKSSSTSGGASVKLTLTIVNLPNNLSSGSWVEIYLEDDYQEPDSISRQDVVFIATNADGTGTPATNDGGTVTAAAVEIDDGGEIGNPDLTKDDDEDAVVISARIPDMDPRDDNFGYPVKGQTLMMIVSSSAEIKNPTEATSNSTGYAIVGAGEDRGDVADVKLTDLLVKAKIGLSADDGGRGKALTVTGSGFNNGTEATVYVQPNAIAMWWDGLNCEMMNDAVSPEDDEPAVGADTDGTTYCKMYADLSDEAKPVVKRAGLASEDVCQQIVDDGDSLGTDGVGSNDKFEVEFTVHQDEFDAGEVNYICAADNESPSNRLASAVKVFDVTPSLTISPDSASSGEEVTLKPRDFSSGTIEVSLDGDEDATYPADTDDDFVLTPDGTSDYVFDMPGGLSGVVQVSFKQGGDTERGTITVDPSSLTLNQTEVAPNQSIIISGSGFSEDSYVLVEKITIDGEPLVVDESGVEGVTSKEATDADMPADDGKDAVKTTSSGQFTVTVNVWHDGADNPALDADEYTIKVTDSNGYEGKTKITIWEPTVMVTPVVAGPRDTITIRGTNWPVTTSDDDHDVNISIDGKTRSVSIDSIGRFNYSYQLSGGIDIGTEHDITVMFDGGVGGDIEETITFSVPSANVVITPLAAAPGESIDLEITGMPIYERVTQVTIDGGNRMGGTAINTDSEGDVTITGIVIPFADPGFYPVKIVVGTGGSAETAIVQLEILAESDVRGVTSPLPGAVMDLGDSVVRIFHFNTSSKGWTFYDPRPEFEDLNTLTELAAGQPYWILVSENVENVVLNGRTRNLTCVGGDCWNQEVW